MARRSLDYVRKISGVLLVIYVTVELMVSNLGSSGIIEQVLVQAIHSWIDVPTALVLITYSGLTIRGELYKPKYRMSKKDRGYLDAFLLIISIIIFLGYLYLKYFINLNA
ncbi:hypothetical protein [Methanooceanicella nereidis]|nr:hypothetical protein [Methanocella sp. CWC-04]